MRVTFKNKSTKSREFCPSTTCFEGKQFATEKNCKQCGGKAVILTELGEKLLEFMKKHLDKE